MAPSQPRRIDCPGGRLLLLLLCREVDGWGGVSETGWGARSSCQMRRARWRLSERTASRCVLPSVFRGPSSSIRACHPSGSDLRADPKKVREMTLAQRSIGPGTGSPEDVRDERRGWEQ
jgi:hypothetical protein